MDVPIVFNELLGTGGKDFHQCLQRFSYWDNVFRFITRRLHLSAGWLETSLLLPMQYKEKLCLLSQALGM